MTKVIAELNDIVKTTFGTDASALVARCPAFGNDDCCVIFTGTKHKLAARLFATKVSDPKIATSQSEFMGHVSESTSVTW